MQIIWLGLDMALLIEIFVTNLYTYTKEFLLKLEHKLSKVHLFIIYSPIILNISFWKTSVFTLASSASLPFIEK